MTYAPILNPSTGQRFPRRGPLATEFPFLAPLGIEVRVPTAAGAFQVNAPTAGLFDGAIFAVSDADGNAVNNNITISGNGRTIDGAATHVINAANGSEVLIYDADEDAWHMLLFARAVTDPVSTNVYSQDLASVVSPVLRVSTLYGDGTASANATANNPSHIVGDVISWEPAAGGNFRCYEAHVRAASTLTTTIALLPIADLTTYAIDVTMSVKRDDGSGVSERLKLSGVVNRDDAHGGVHYTATQTETDPITTDGSAAAMQLALSTAGDVLSLVCSSIGGVIRGEFEGAVRVAAQVTAF